jgi:hypothetical protein
MEALKVGAQFAAYVWFTNRPGGQKRIKEAQRFAQRNWDAFLPVANEGWGRLLIRLNRAWEREEEKKRLRRQRNLVAAAV